jgi:hypothetical protein
MFCPKCRMEYREGYTVCKECNEKLVEELPLESQEPLAKQASRSSSLIVIFETNIEKWLKAGGIIYIFLGVLNDIAKSLSNTSSLHDQFSIASFGVVFSAIGFCASVLYTILWGLFYFGLGRIIEILREGFKNEK